MTKLNDIIWATSLATGIPCDVLLNSRPGTGSANAALAREKAMWVAVTIYGIETWEIAALMRRPKSAIKAGVIHIDRLNELSIDVRQKLSEIVLAIDRLEADTVRQSIRKYRERGATVPSIARFVGVPVATVAMVLGISWAGAANEHHQ